MTSDAKIDDKPSQDVEGSNDTADDSKHTQIVEGSSDNTDKSKPTQDVENSSNTVDDSEPEQDKLNDKEHNSMQPKDIVDSDEPNEDTLAMDPKERDSGSTDEANAQKVPDGADEAEKTGSDEKAELDAEKILDGSGDSVQQQQSLLIDGVCTNVPPTNDSEQQNDAEYADVFVEPAEDDKGSTDVDANGEGSSKPGKSSAMSSLCQDATAGKNSCDSKKIARHKKKGRRASSCCKKSKAKK